MLALPTHAPPHLHDRYDDHCVQSPTLQLPSATMSFASMPFAHPPAPKRPKLSLRTSMTPPPFGQQSTTALNIITPIDSAVTRNTYANTFDTSSPVGSKSQSNSPQRFQASNTSSSTTSPLSQTSSPPSHTSYHLPASPHSILRNSPLPRRHISATSSRVSKRMFPPVKRVSFCDRPVQVIPTATVKDLECFEPEVREQRQVDAATEVEDIDNPTDDVPATPVQGRRKKRREWVWTLGRLDNTLPGVNPSMQATALALQGANCDEASGMDKEMAGSFTRTSHERIDRGHVD